MKNILLIGLIPIVGAVHASTNDFLTWEQSLDLTKIQSPDLISARAAVRELEFGAASASSGFLPSITASASGSYGESENRNNDWNERESSGGELTLSQDLFSGGGTKAKRRRALAQLQIGEEQYRKTLSDVELRLRLAYVDVLYAQELIELSHEIATRRSNNVRLIQLRFDGGRENAGSLARSKAQLAEARFEVREAQRDLDYALRNWAAAMGQSTLVSGAAGSLKADVPSALPELENLVKKTPAYQISTTQVELAEQGVLISRSSRFPSIRFTASYGANSVDHENYTGSWNTGLRASVPIYSGNRLNSDTAAAKEQVIQSEMGLLDQENSLLATLQQRWNSYVGAVENEAVQTQSLEAEELRAEIATARYKQGLLDYENWDIIESSLIAQERQLLQRRRTAGQEQARWKNVLGQSVWDTMDEGK